MMISLISTCIVPWTVTVVNIFVGNPDIVARSLGTLAATTLVSPKLKKGDVLGNKIIL